MGRITGDALFSANFEVRKGAPLDTRTVVDEKADLVLLSTWDTGDGNAYVYKGMLVVVINDTEDNNGVYKLVDLDYTVEANWQNIVGGSGGSFEDWTTNNLTVKSNFYNYNPDKKDVGVKQNSDVRGLHRYYIADKRLANCYLGQSAESREGSLRNNNGIFQVYLQGIWQDIVTNFRFREDGNGGYELEHRPVRFDTWLEVMSGNSNEKGLSGLPLVQQYKTSIGAYQVPLEIDGGTF